jgi:GNAT superfamily N-acetyltransferase
MRSAREVLIFMARVLVWPEPDPLPPPDESYSRPGLVALDGDALVGGLTWDDSAGTQEGEVLTILRPAVLAERRRQGIGTRLMAAFSALPHLPQRRRILVNSFENTDVEAVTAFLEKHGFVVFDRSLLYRRTVHVAPILKGPWRRLEYRGGDVAVDASIVDLTNRGYRTRSGIGALTVEMMASAATEPTLRWLCLYEDDAMVGCVQMHFNEGKEAFVLNIVVARSHWGGGASEALADWIVAFCAEHGCGKLEASVNERNHASRRFVERNAMRIVESYPRFSRLDDPR